MELTTQEKLFMKQVAVYMLENDMLDGGMTRIEEAIQLVLDRNSKTYIKIKSNPEVVSDLAERCFNTTL